MIGKTVNVEEGKFAALAGAFAQNGVVLYIPKGVTVEEPLHSVLWGPGADLAHVSHILVLVDEGASVTYVHEFSVARRNGIKFHARGNRGNPGDAGRVAEIRRTAILGTSRLEFLVTNAPVLTAAAIWIGSSARSVRALPRISPSLTWRAKARRDACLVFISRMAISILTMIRSKIILRRTRPAICCSRAR